MSRRRHGYWPACAGAAPQDAYRRPLADASKKREIRQVPKSSLVSWNVFAPVNTAIITRTSAKVRNVSFVFRYRQRRWEKFN